MSTKKESYRLIVFNQNSQLKFSIVLFYFEHFAFVSRRKKRSRCFALNFFLYGGDTLNFLFYNHTRICTINKKKHANDNYIFTFYI
jgi:hypothetical protein